MPAPGSPRPYTATLATVMLTPRIMFFALCLTVVVYCVIAFIAGQPQPGTPATSNPSLLVAVGIASVAVMLAIPVLRARLMPPRRSAEALGDVDPARPLSEAAKQAVLKLAQVHILSWALSESIAIFGLVLAFTTRVPTWVLPFAAVALGNMARYAPRRSLAEEVVRAADAAGG